jgi:hypothetical protein
MRAAINSEIELGTAPARAAAPRPTFWQNEAKFANEINRSARETCHGPNKAEKI